MLSQFVEPCIHSELVKKFLFLETINFIFRNIGRKFNIFPNIHVCEEVEVEDKLLL
jgi:hypothetical protein